MKKTVISLIITSVLLFALSFSSIFIFKHYSNKGSSFNIESEGFVELAIQEDNYIDYVCVDKTYQKIQHIDKFESDSFELYLYWNKKMLDAGEHQIEGTTELNAIANLCDESCKNTEFSIYKINEEYIVSETNIGNSCGLLVYLYKDNSLIQFSKGVLGSYTPCNIVGIKFI